ncbi:ligand-binding sensor domain-containing protein [Noviherbaspirillum galbum]|uniref:histidine kinase n=1 Tax=Noviherbaspirillum galbum TaxID=2709383 RepID=A0A6B3SQL1_9BURK|nr:sensor histidine kinase [Noviherbaspirillum galbum]NEX62808.1 hypothetical protein [Noviherbaspirillum galbum]
MLSIVLSFLWLVLPASAQTPLNLAVERFSVRQGLDIKGGWSIAEDRYGFMWFGGQLGLSRFDGYRFVTYRHDENDPASLADNLVRALIVDKENRLWVGTQRGLQRFRSDTNRFETIHLAQEKTDDADIPTINELVPGTQNDLWVASEAGLYHLDLASGAHYKASSGDRRLQYLPIKSVTLDGEGNVWVGTAFGMYRRKPGEEVFHGFPERSDRPDDPAEYRVNALLVDDENELWIGLDNGLERWSLDGRQRQRFTLKEGFLSDQVLTLAKDSHGSVWVGTSWGAYRWNKSLQKFQSLRQDELDQRSLAGLAVRRIFEDSRGNVWIGETHIGINRVINPNGEFERIAKRIGKQNNLSDISIRSLLAYDGSHLWIGTVNGGLNLLDRASGQIKVYRNESLQASNGLAGPISALCHGHGHAIWVGSSHGLSRFDTLQERFTPVDLKAITPRGNSIVACAYEPASKQLWLTSGSEVHRHDVETGETAHYAYNALDPDGIGPSGIQYSAILPLPEGEVWIGAFTGGLSRLQRGPTGAARFTRFRLDSNDPGSLSNDTVMALFRDHAGVIWVGTAAGLNRVVFRDDGKVIFVRYRRDEGLQDESINSILEDQDGNLWLGTESGLTRLDKARRQFRHFNASDGMIESGFLPRVATRGPDGLLAFGGHEGLNLFYSEAIRQSTHAPRAVLTAVTLANLAIQPGQRLAGVKMSGPVERLAALELAPEHRVFGLEFAGLLFADPQHVRYSYQLEGFDTDWIETDPANRRATYTNLDPGDYVFRLRVAYGNEPWESSDVKVNITILPEFWETWWFRGLLVVLAHVIAIALIRWYGREIARRYEVEKLAVKAQAELQSAEAQQRFVAMVSHEFRNPLALMDASLKNIRRMAEAVPEQFMERVQKIQRAHLRMQGLIDNYLTEEVMKTRDLEPRKQEVDFADLLGEVVAYAQVAAPDHVLHLRVQGDLPPMLLDREMIRVAFSNLVDNGIKYSPKQGMAEITAAMEGSGTVRVIVADNGVGIHESDLPHIFERFFRASHGQAGFKGVGLGLHLVHRIIELHQGSIAVASTVGKGTRFVVHLPVRAQEAAPAGDSCDEAPREADSVEHRRG